MITGGGYFYRVLNFNYAFYYIYNQSIVIFEDKAPILNYSQLCIKKIGDIIGSHLIYLFIRVKLYL